MRMTLIVAICGTLSACAPSPAGGYYEGDGPRRPAVQPYRGDDRRYDDRRTDDRRTDDRRTDDRRRDDAGARPREQDSARRQQDYNRHVADLQAQHNQRVVGLQQQFNQGRITRGQLDSGYRQAEQDLGRGIANEQRSLPR